MKKLWKNDGAVSSVIGVIMMVGMSVIMISVVAVSVMGFALPESAPQAKIVVVEARGDTDMSLYKTVIELKHKGGDALFKNDTKIIITGRGCKYTTGTDMCASLPVQDIRVTYKDLAGENCIISCNSEIVEGTSWDAGETITLYGSVGNDLYLLGWQNNVDSRWKLDDGSTVLVTVIDTTTNEVIAVSQSTVKDA